MYTFGKATRDVSNFYWHVWVPNTCRKQWPYDELRRVDIWPLGDGYLVRAFLSEDKLYHGANISRRLTLEDCLVYSILFNVVINASASLCTDVCFAKRGALTRFITTGLHMAPGHFVLCLFSLKIPWIKRWICGAGVVGFAGGDSSAVSLRGIRQKLVTGPSGNG